MILYSISNTPPHARAIRLEDVGNAHIHLPSVETQIKFIRIMGAIGIELQTIKGTSGWNLLLTPDHLHWRWMEFAAKIRYHYDIISL